MLDARLFMYYFLYHLVFNGDTGFMHDPQIVPLKNWANVSLCVKIRTRATIHIVSKEVLKQHAHVVLQSWEKQALK